eukprot:jgi/Bigna1/144600/aug1.89_g19308
MPYLPETMRDLNSLETMLKNPTFKVVDTKYATEDGGMDMKPPKDLTPEEIMEKLMEDPELAKAFENPKVRKAIIDSTTDPTKFVDYSNDKEIMSALTRIAEAFPADRLTKA